MSKSKNDTASEWIARTFAHVATLPELDRMLQVARQDGLKRLESVGADLLANCNKHTVGPFRIYLTRQLEAARRAEAKATEAKAATEAATP